MKNPYLSFTKADYQFFTSKTRVSDFFLNYCSSFHYLVALAASFSKNYLLALTSFAAFDRDWITTLVFDNTKLMISSELKLPVNSTTFPSSLYK